MRLGRRLAAILLGTVVGVSVGAGPAAAHPTLLFTTPAVDTAEPVSPPSLALIFNEPVSVGPGALRLIGADDVAHPVADVRADSRRRAVTARPAVQLGPGTYTVRWRVTGADGDLVESTFRFVVGSGVGSPAEQGRVADDDTAWPAAGWRWLLFLGLTLSLGGSVARRLVDAALVIRPSLPHVQGAEAVGALAGLAAVTGASAVLIGSDGAGALAGSPAGRILLLQGASFVACLALLVTSRVRWSGLPLLFVAVAEGVRSHAHQAAPGWGAALTSVHLIAGAIWVGALLQVVRVAVTWRAQPVAVTWVVLGYARWAGWLFATVVATGGASVLVLAPWPLWWNSAYHRLLVLKLSLVAVAAAGALIARTRLRRADTTGRGVRLSTRVEAAALALVLGVSAALVSTLPPEGVVAPPAPAPDGVVLPLGSLAGQVGVAVAASRGQVVVRLSAPRRDDYYAPEAAQEFRLRATASVGGASKTLRMRSCGVGCFVGVVEWVHGDTVLDLRAEAEGWRGGAVSMVVPWPVEEAPDRLVAAVAAMRAAGRVTVYETVTSDTAGPPPEPVRLTLSGADFVATQPYSAGLAPLVTQLPADGGQVRLAVGFPAERRYADLRLDAQGRIVEETLVDAKHLTRRRFVYERTGT